MTLRGRLTTAFLAVVLGPVLLGAVFVGTTVAAVSYERTVDRLDTAAATVRTSVSALCQQMHAAADAVAVPADPARRAGTASQLVARGLVSAVLISDADGRAAFATAGNPPQPWADCAAQAAPDADYEAIAVRVEMRAESGALIGEVVVTQVLDHAFLSRLAAATGTGVTLLPGVAAPTVRHTTEPATGVDAVLDAAARAEGDAIAETGTGRYVRRINPSPGQPLPLALSVPRGQPQGLYVVLIGAVLAAGFAAVVAAWWLARSTTRPLAELARAADRVADGDLAARVPVHGHDEVGRLATTFNRMTRETQSYVQALTASRDQLRGHLAVLGDTLSSTHDLQRILQVILQTALAATGARAGVVLLLDPASGLLVGQCAEGLDERWPVGLTGRPGTAKAGAGKAGARTNGAVVGVAVALQDRPGRPDHDPAALRVSLGSGLLGAVAATGEPRRGRVDRDGPHLSTHEPRCRTYVAVPFSAPGPATDAPTTGVPAGRLPGALWPPTLPTALGVLALYDRLGSDEFDDTDLVTLRTFAGQAAVAVDNVRVHEEAQRLSLTDPLTGLWNYRYLKESIRREVERANRFGRMLTVLALDLDRFKHVNDTHGHAAGDTVLAEFARRLRAEIREVDLAFRQGGEEFVVLLPETDAAGGAIVAQRLAAAVRDVPVPIEPHLGAPPTSIPVTVSIGIAVYPDHGATGDQVLDAADEALYAAKAAGRDTHRVASTGPRPEPGKIAGSAGPRPPDDGVPHAGGRSADGPGGASSGPQPPRQSRGR
ncbi:diguanylate cyclase [Polymorphospora sp. NPDC050346]|uniref:diguanylate cyclase n=1 Tax=Polymorphospora sp. NPDC050346 TaxID=3155780 RepID=UPI0033CDF896